MARKKIINIYADSESGKTIPEILSGYSMDNGEIAVIKSDEDSIITAKVSDEENGYVEFVSKKYVDEAKRETFHSKPVKIADFLYGINYSHVDYDYGKKVFEDEIEASNANCSALRVGNFVGRNFDWKYNWQATFVISTPAEYGRKAVIGVAGNVKELTVDAVDSEKELERYSFLPFHILDGINEDGLFCEINVTHKCGIERVQPTGEKTDTVCAEMLPRYILDHYSTVDEAVADLKEHVEIYTPKSLLDMDYEIHCLIADKEKTVILEFDEDSERLVSTDAHILTNYKVSGVTYNEDGSVYTNVDAANGIVPTVENNLEEYADGLERWNTLNSFSASVVDNKTMRDLMASINYSNAYTKDIDDNFWYSEFVGNGPDKNITIDTPYTDEKFQARCQYYKDGFSAKTRDAGEYWITCHQCVYDIDKKEFTVCVQEDVEHEYKFSFEKVNFDEILDIIKTDEKVISSALNDLNARIVSTDGKFENYYDKSETYTQEEVENIVSAALDGYATESWVEGKGYLTEHQSLEEYAKKVELPTKTSDLTNDSGFITDNSLDDYYTKDELTGENGIITENEEVVASALTDLDERIRFGSSIEIEATGATVTRKNIEEGGNVIGQKFEISVEAGSNYEAGDGIDISENVISIDSDKLSAINKITGNTVAISGTQITVGSENLFAAGNEEEEGKFEPSSSVTKALNWLKENKVSKSYFDGTLANYATKSNLDNAIKSETARTESTYLKEHQSLDGYYTEAETDTLLSTKQNVLPYEVVEYDTMTTEKAIEIFENPSHFQISYYDGIYEYAGMYNEAAEFTTVANVNFGEQTIRKIIITEAGMIMTTTEENEFLSESYVSSQISAAMNSETSRTETAYAKKTALEGKQDKIANLQEIIDNAASGKTAYDKLGGHTVEKDVPADAKFTDTIYDDTSLTNRISAIEGKEAEWDAKLQFSDIIDDTVSTATTKALSANQGKVLNDTITENTQQLRLSINGEKEARESAVIALENSISQKRGTNITVGENISGYTSSESSLTESLRAAFEIIDRLDSYPSLPKLPELERTMTGNIPPENAWVGETVEIPSVDWYLTSGEFIADYSNEFENWPIPSYTSETSASEPRTGFTYIDDTHATVCEGDNVIKYKAYADYSAPTNKPLRKSGIQTDKTGRTDTNTSAIWPASGLDDEYKIMTTGEWAIISNALTGSVIEPSTTAMTTTATTSISTGYSVVKIEDEYVAYLGMQSLRPSGPHWEIQFSKNISSDKHIYMYEISGYTKDTISINNFWTTGDTEDMIIYSKYNDVNLDGQYLKITFKNKQQ